MYFFDSTENDERIYQAADFARFHAQIIGNGVSNTANLPDLEVSERTNMDIALGAGYMFANGYMYELTETTTLTHDVADPDNDRIDRVTIRFDSNPEKREIKAVIKKGTPAGSPNPPSLTRDDYIHEMSVAQIRIKAGKSYIERDQITDERANDAVCGYIPLHNIYRGIQVDESGMIQMLNQSHVTVYANDEQELPYNDRVKMIFPNVHTDTQSEYDPSRSMFTARSKGVIMVNPSIDFDINHDTFRFAVYVYKNGEIYQRIAHASGTSPNVQRAGIDGTSLVPVEIGDELEIYVFSAQESNTRGYGLPYTRCDFFKIA